MCSTRSERLTTMLSASMRHRVGVVVVSSGTESFSCTSICASSILAPFSSTVCLSKSIPSLFRKRRPKEPFTRAASTKSPVFRRTPLTSSSLMTTRLSIRGISCTSTTIRCTAAMLSALKSVISRSRGNDKSTCPTLMSMPVFSEAMAATLSTAQFCTGGR